MPWRILPLGTNIWPNDARTFYPEDTLIGAETIDNFRFVYLDINNFFYIEIIMRYVFLHTVQSMKIVYSWCNVRTIGLVPWHSQQIIGLIMGNQWKYSSWMISVKSSRDFWIQVSRLIIGQRKHKKTGSLLYIQF